MSKQMLIAAKSTSVRGTLARLRSDASGNVLAMAAAAIFPLAGMMGGALDLSRIYLVKTRLQAACDAGALTGRRVMGSGSWANNSYKARTQAENVFLTNFGEESYGTGTLTKTFTENAGNVSGVASTTIPMTVMQLFGSGTHTVNVSCNSEQRIPNTDVMFVLDTTGSMNCAPADTIATCTNNGGTEKSEAKIKGLRTAVKCFYEALAKLDTTESCGSTPSGGNSAAVQLRFGFMPYSSNVNVGKLLPTSYFPDNWSYQSKAPIITSGYSYVLGTESARTGFGNFSNPSQSTFDTASSGGYASFARIGSNSNATSTVTVGGTPFIYKVSQVYVDKNDGKGPVLTTVNATMCAGFNSLAASGSSLIAREVIPGAQVDALVNPMPATPTYPATQQTLNYKRTEPNTVNGYRYRWQAVSSTNGCWLEKGTGSFNRIATGGTSTKPINWSPQSTVTGWTNQVVNFNISGLKNGASWNSSVNLPLAQADAPSPNSVYFSGQTSPTTLQVVANTSVAWSGCIEERRTYQNIDPTDPSLDWSPVPSVANDMNIDMVPDMSDINTQWKPALPDALIDPSNGASGSNTLSCPAQATRLQTYPTPSTFETDVDSLIARGSTYHDVGLIWGARFMSPTGIFAAANATTPSGGAIQRHMIFMTDGDTGTCSGAYSPHGVVGFGDRRQTTKASIPDNGGSLCNNDFLNKIVDARTAAACTAIKNMNITLWVIGFGTGVSAATKTRLTNCASPSSYFDAADSAALNTKFKQIADDISQLRLTN
jgi:Flp pilus assembly protein TadG